jgi:hypothetical protein
VYELQEERKEEKERASGLFILFLWGTLKKRPNHMSQTQLENIGPTKGKGA